MSDASRDWDLEQAAERRYHKAEQRAEQFLGDGWPELPRSNADLPQFCKALLLAPLVAAGQIDHEQAARALYGDCPECGEPNRPRHICPAKD